MNKFYLIFLLMAIQILSYKIVAQNRAFKNGGFETPLITGVQGYNNFISANAPAGTAGTRIEEWNTTSSNFFVEYRNLAPNRGEPSAAGNQHAEVNGNNVARLYQNVCLVNGEILNYSYYHRGRQGSDEMELNLYDESGTNKVGVLKTSVTDNSAWKLYTGTYNVTVPTGIYQFSFEAVSTFNNSPSEGNLVDEVSINLAPIVSFEKGFYSGNESTVNKPLIKVNGIVPAGGLVITFSCKGSSAIQNTDFILNDLIVPAGTYTSDSPGFPIPLTIVNDNVNETNETILINLNSVVNGSRTDIGCKGFPVISYLIEDDDVFDAGTDLTVCKNDTVILTATGGTGPVWNRGVRQGTKFPVTLPAGNYTYLVKDTVYSQNMVLNPDFNEGNTGFNSQYVYDPRVDPGFLSGYLSPGGYNIVTLARLAHRNFLPVTDHTSGNGNMLVVNASVNPDKYLWGQKFNVQPNTNYSFSFWVNWVSSINSPFLQLSINGSAYGPLHIPSIPGAWHEVKYQWNSGPDTSAFIGLEDKNLNDVGNDFALDDIFFAPLAYLKDSLKITVKSTPVPFTKNIDTCQHIGNYTSTAIGSDLKWYTASIGGTGSVAAPVINLNVPDTISEWVSQTENGCESARSELKIVIKPLPALPTGKDTSLCQQTGSVTLQAAGFNIKWHDAAVAGNLIPDPTYNTNVPDTLDVWVSQTQNTCESPRKKLNLKIIGLPAAPILKDSMLCQQSGSITLKGTGTNMKWYDAVTAGNIIGNLSFNTDIPDTIIAWASQTLNGCESSRSRITVSVKALPPLLAVRDTILCQQAGSISLSANGFNLKWYDSQFAGNVISPVYNTNIPDTVNVWVSQNVEACEGARTKQNLQIRKLPARPLTNDTIICRQPGSVTVNAIGNNIKWYDASSGGNTVSDLTFNTDISDTIYVWATQSKNGCESLRERTKVKIKELPSEPVTKDTTICRQAGSYTFKATGSNLKWYDGPVSESLVSNLTFNTNIADTIRYWVSQTFYHCEGPRKPVSLTIVSLPGLPAVADQYVCENSGNVTLQAAGSDLVWYDRAIAGNSGIVAPVFSTSVADTITRWVSQKLQSCESLRARITLYIKPLPGVPIVKDTMVCQKPGNTTYAVGGTDLTWYNPGLLTKSSLRPVISTNLPDQHAILVSQTIAGCEGPKAAAAVEVKQAPSPPVAFDQIICQGPGNTNYVADGTAVRWYSDTNTAISAAVAPFIDNNISGLHILYATQTLNNCESLKQEVKIKVNALPPAPLLGNIDLCKNDKQKIITVLTDSLFWYTSQAGGTALSETPVATTDVPGITDYWVSTIKSGCESTRINVKVTVHALPVIKITGFNTSGYCISSSLSLSASGGDVYNWNTPTSANFQEANLNISSIVLKDQGTYVLTGTDIHQCKAKDSVTVLIKNLPSISADPVTVCEKSPVKILAKTTGSVSWKLPNNRLQYSQTLSLPVSSYSDNGIYVLTSTLNGCSDSVTVKVTVTNCPPQASNDYYTVFADEKLSLKDDKSPLLNDKDPNDILLPGNITFLNVPRLGELTRDGNGDWMYTPTTEHEGTEILDYTICDTGKPVLCSEGKITIEIKTRDVFFPDAFTPNDDGVNDTYIVYNVPSRVKISINIFNRWGDQVFESSEYQNNWKGTCTATACIGTELPSGTYFVVAQLSNGKKHSTYLTLNR